MFGELQGHLDPDVDASLVDGAQTDAPVGPADDASTDATLVDVATDASVPDVVRAAGPTVCSKKGGEMTALAPRKGGLPHLCIDTSEVTRNAYTQFAAETSGASPASRQGYLVGAPVLCSDKIAAGFAPGDASAAKCTDGYCPVGQVDYCDAYAFCSWAGKKMCGEIGPDPVTTPTPREALNAWQSACSQNGKQTFPYDGSTYKSQTCNIGLIKFLQPVDTFPLCASPGLDAGSKVYDLVGNAYEWAGPRSSTGCYFYGGAYSEPIVDAGCYFASPIDLKHRYEGLGFRCCSETP